MENEKVFKTNDELIALLDSRGVNVSSGHKGYAKKVFQHDGYFNIINGYNKLFLITKIPDDKYKPGTTVEEIYALYDFDKRLRDIIFKYLLMVERNVKNLIAYVFSDEYGHDNYMLYKNFDTSQRNAQENITNLISDIQHQISSRSSDPVITHYLKKYGYIPLWVLNNILTFGQISKFYHVLKQKDKQQVSKTFHINDSELESILYYLSIVRNFCAHGNRLYCFRTKKPLINLSAHKSLQIPLTEGSEYQYGKRDFFACIIALSYMLPSSEYKRLIKEIYRLFSSTRPKLKVITEDNILKEMGFPKDWREKALSLASLGSRQNV